MRNYRGYYRSPSGQLGLRTLTESEVYDGKNLRRLGPIEKILGWPTPAMRELLDSPVLGVYVGTDTHGTPQNNED